MQNASGGVRMVDLPGDNHYLFLNNPEDVFRELKVFLAESSLKAKPKLL